MAEHTVYILLTRSGSWFSRLIHLATQDRYTHASIGLDGPSGPFYSFGRKYEHFALPAGLVEEQVTPGRTAVPCCLYALPVDEDTYLRCVSGSGTCMRSGKYTDTACWALWPAGSSSPFSAAAITFAPSL